MNTKRKQIAGQDGFMIWAAFLRDLNNSRRQAARTRPDELCAMPQKQSMLSRFGRNVRENYPGNSI
jgi:hypothetical protein